MFQNLALACLSLAAGALSAPTDDGSGKFGQPYSRHGPRPPWYGHGGSGQQVTTTVDLGYSTYEGTALEAGVNQWLGIRYAAPPLGDLRWRAPQDPIANDTLQQATEFAPTCLGLFGPGLSNTTNEDCLFLDVFAPANATVDSKLPVWFFIQGGGYAGNTDQDFNSTEVVVKSGFNVVFVQINYRVGAFGFLASERIRQNGDLNVGLLDQRFALHWAQKYIHLFGGDPDHVVIHGDSAGAGSIAYHLTAYGGRDDGLFVGGIAESPFWPTHRTVPEMEFQFEEFAANLSCADATDVLDCLRSKDTAELQSADVAGVWPGAPDTAEWFFLPVVDGTFSTDYLYNLFEQGKVVRVPVIVGDDTDEGTGFSPNAANSTQFLDFIKSNYPKLTAADLQLIKETYLENGFGTFALHADYFAATETAYGEATFICPGIEMSSSLAAYNTPLQSWNYRYNVQDQAYIALGLGVPHVSEKPAIFGVNSTGPCDGCSYETYNAPIVPIVMDYWLSFIRSLNPNTYKNDAAPVWEPWTSSLGYGGHRFGHGWQQGAQSSPQRLKIQTNATEMESVPRAQLNRCEVWKKLADVSEQ